jgi:hypothetical protein
MKANLYKVLFLLLVGFLTLSCKKESEPALVSLVGTWTYGTSDTVTTYKNDGTTTTGNVTYPLALYTVTFEADGATVQKINKLVTSSGAYTYTGTVLTVTAGQTLPGANSIYTVSSLTSNALVLSETYTDSRVSFTTTHTLTR